MVIFKKNSMTNKLIGQNYIWIEGKGSISSDESNKPISIQIIGNVFSEEFYRSPNQLFHEFDSSFGAFTIKLTVFFFFFFCF